MSESPESVAAPAFTMIGSESAAACEGDACAIIVEPDTASTDE